MAKLSWKEKLHRPDKPIITDINLKMQKRFGKGKMLIATPLLIESVVRQIPKGKLTTLNHIMAKLAKDFSTDITCPLTTGIFIKIIAGAAKEDLNNGKKRVTPYWRVLKLNGRLNDKYPGGAVEHAKFLELEGHSMELNQKKLPFKVKDFRKCIIEFK